MKQRQGDVVYEMPYILIQSVMKDEAATVFEECIESTLDTTVPETRHLGYLVVVVNRINERRKPRSTSNDPPSGIDCTALRHVASRVLGDVLVCNDRLLQIGAVVSTSHVVVVARLRRRRQETMLLVHACAAIRKRRQCYVWARPWSL